MKPYAVMGRLTIKNAYRIEVAKINAGRRWFGKPSVRLRVWSGSDSEPSYYTLTDLDAIDGTIYVDVT